MNQSESAGWRGFCADTPSSASENVALWHERDISHNSTERVTFPDACILLDYMLDLMSDLMENLVIYPERMLKNLESTGGLIYSQRVLLALVDAGLDRQDAYKIVQRHALQSWDEGGSFRVALLSDPVVAERISESELDSLFDHREQLKQIDPIFARLGLDPRIHAEGKA